MLDGALCMMSVPLTPIDGAHLMLNVPNLILNGTIIMPGGAVSPMRGTNTRLFGPVCLLSGGIQRDLSRFFVSLSRPGFSRGGGPPKQYRRVFRRPGLYPYGGKGRGDWRCRIVFL